MAALIRPSLRSASQRTVGVELSATDNQRKSPTHITKTGKRSHDSALLNDDFHVLKKQKTAIRELPRQSIAQSHDGDASLVPPNQLPKGVLTQGVNSRSTKPEQAGQDVKNIGTNTIDNDRMLGDTAIEVGTALVTRKVDKRSLRSQDGGSRSKSELALYFPNYDELVSIEPKESGKKSIMFLHTSRMLIVPEFLTIDTLVHITDEPLKSTALNIHSSASLGHASNSQNPITNHYPLKVNGFPQKSEEFEVDLTKLIDAQQIDFSSIEHSTKLLQEDPMTDAVYLKAHRRLERQEKQLRNIEKERAQHEKVQLERLLDGLKGHDWLRVMGISGITDSEKKLYEPKRERFVQEVESLLDKFRVWKEEEKRRKFEKEQKAEEDDEDDSEASDGEPPDYSDVDAWAARQLHREASSANGTQTGKNRNHRSQPINVIPLPIEKPFTSFFSKPYLREAALGKRRRGRTTFAFGHPVPDFLEHEFELPSDLLTKDALNANARKRRRANRETKDHRERPN